MAARASAVRRQEPRHDTATQPLSPPLKWAGGKRWQLPHVRPLWAAHAHRRLVEPFCGGLAIALGLRPRRALLNDLNPHLINFYARLKDGLRIDLRLENNRTVFYTHRARFNALVHDQCARTDEAAALFYYLNRTCYNGLCRFNSAGEFNVPFGQYARIAYARDFDRYRSTFAGWEFSSADFESLAVDAGDFIYADPPYDVEFTKYAKEGFSWDDQVRTAEWLSRHPGPTVLVNQATDRICELYRDLGFEIRILTAPRRISCTGDRRPAREIFATAHL